MATIKYTNFGCRSSFWSGVMEPIVPLVFFWCGDRKPTRIELICRCQNGELECRLNHRNQFVPLCLAIVLVHVLSWHTYRIRLQLYLNWRRRMRSKCAIAFGDEYAIAANQTHVARKSMSKTIWFISKNSFHQFSCQSFIARNVRRQTHTRIPLNWQICVAEWIAGCRRKIILK